MPGPEQQPETPCIENAHQHGLTTFWEAVVSKAGVDPGTAALGNVDIEILPDDSIKRIFMSFTADRQGQDVLYFAGYRDRTSGCGSIDVHGGTIDRRDPVEQFPQDPRAFFEDIVKELGLRNESVSVSTDNVRGSIAYIQRIRETAWMHTCWTTGSSGASTGFHSAMIGFPRTPGNCS